ncbi:MAG TPA: aldo/keto reductase [Spirochaetia bacterium]|nr:aldo/keto reductase [Spirochaetia bacterium]
MKTVSMGKSGLKVSRLCLGTMTFGREADERTSAAIMDYFVEQGGTFLDTADAYSSGATESVVGRWLKARGNRDNLVVATKVFAQMGSGANDGGLSRIHIHRAAEESLRRLQTDVIDLYQVHRWDATVPIEETLQALDDLVRQGKVRYVGCSNLRAYQLQYCRDYARAHTLSPFISLQPAYNALNRSIEAELLPLCAEQGIGVLSYNPLAGGMLTGKYRRNEPLPKGARLEAYGFYHDRYYTEQALDIVERFLQEAARRGVTPAQLALAWVLAEPRITTPILGARSLEQITDSLKGAEIELSASERAEIPAVPVAHWVGEDTVYGR